MSATTVPNASIEAAAPAIPFSRRLYWCLRRELWENHSIYLVPLAVAAVFLIGFLIKLIHLPADLRTASSLEAMKQHELAEAPYLMVSLLLMATTMLVALFYSVDALYAERRDRSILFWKSLPVSDSITVLAKALIPIAIIPLVAFAVGLITQVLMLTLSTLVLWSSGMNAAVLWSHLSLAHMWPMLFLHLLLMHGFWYAPFYGWLLFVSAWARRAPILWATVPLLMIGVLEKIAFNTAHFARMLQYRLVGNWEDASSTAGKSMEMLLHVSLGTFFTRPGFWIGMAISAAFLAATVRLRRYREPI